MPALNIPKLAKTLELLSSDREGEQLAAALAAHRLVTAAGLTWEALLLPCAPSPRWRKPPGPSSAELAEILRRHRRPNP